MEQSEYELMYRIETNYWWFVARRGLVTKLIAKWLKPNAPLAILDVGCGTGANLVALQRFGSTAGCEIEAEAVTFCERRGLQGVVQQTDLNRLPFGDTTFDLVTAFDVIEHIEEVVAMLRETARVLKPGGHLMVTVPAYKFLWSVHDDSMHHKRRYVRSLLHRHFREAGLEPVETTHFNLLLLPLIIPVRWLRDLVVKPQRTTSDFNLDLPRWMNASFRFIFSSEWLWLRFLPLPAGLSVCGLARKPSKGEAL